MKTFLFRFSVAISAFLFGLASFAGYSFLSKPNQLAKIEVAEIRDFIPQIPAQISTSEINEAELGSDEKHSFEDGGYYYIIGEKPIGNKPESFKEFEYFELTLWDYDDKIKDLVPTVPNGFVYAKYPFNFKKVFVGKEHLSFETEQINGISYQFKGKLVDKAYSVIIEKDIEDFIYLEGVLTKLKKGKKVEERALRFGWTLGC